MPTLVAVRPSQVALCASAGAIAARTEIEIAVAPRLAIFVRKFIPSVPFAHPAGPALSGRPAGSYLRDLPLLLAVARSVASRTSVAEVAASCAVQAVVAGRAEEIVVTETSDQVVLPGAAEGDLRPSRRAGDRYRGCR